MKRAFIFGLILVAVAFFFATGGTETYQNDVNGLRFSYHSKFFLTQITDGGRDILSITEDTEWNRSVLRGEVLGVEGPASIIVEVFPNVSEGDPLLWARNQKESNFHLIIGEPTEKEIAGAKAVSYQIDGLYGAEVAVLIHKGSAIMITGNNVLQDEVLRTEFAHVLRTLKLY